MVLSSELTAEELIELEYLHRMLSADSRPQRWRYCPEEPYEKQLQFLDSDKLEAFYGGAAGGGKSSCLLMGSLEYVHSPPQTYSQHINQYNCWTGLLEYTSQEDDTLTLS